MAAAANESGLLDTSNLPPRVSVTDPWVSRYHKTCLLEQDHGPAGSRLFSTVDREVYGERAHPVSFRIGNGGAGFTGLLRMLCETYIREHGNNFRIAWVANHSRYSQLALLADVVQLALTYEPENENLAIEEGWAVRACRAFNDHFVLVGPESELEGRTVAEGLRSIARRNAVGAADQHRSHQLIFHTRGDGSATYCKEQALWKTAGGVDQDSTWIKTHAASPYEALLCAEAEGAYLLSDRATFLTAKEDGVIPSLKVHIEGGPELLNPCAALVRGDAAKKWCQENSAAAKFAAWLHQGRAQEIIHNHGRDWKIGKPLFTIAAQEEFAEEDRLVPT
ncbi:hypothetical protein DOTSEDRAFT_166659 [Dothistroma septosporum NZE10]|uniref:PBP domain-containing protein n=1 Tax=Dothistroma septosporum (strain NZE10 / CBS 128990) TaxID=675120 RepID=N1PZ65_DOTSN|nr:hypothetical protein DOTSEDRAFT_166659 [Dothistroma septosporum NZE10]